MSASKPQYTYECGCPCWYKYSGPGPHLCKDHAPSREVTAPAVRWLALGGAPGGSAFPTAEDKWAKDRERRRAKETESVENHGTEYPNLLTV